MTPISTTLDAIKAHRPCADRYRAFVTALRARDGRVRGDDEPFPLTWVLDLGSWDDALWCTRLTPRVARLFAADCAERVLPLCERERPGDVRPRQAIEVARRFALGVASAEERAAAWAAARAAAWAAERGWQTARLRAYWEGCLPAPLVAMGYRAVEPAIVRHW